MSSLAVATLLLIDSDAENGLQTVELLQQHGIAASGVNSYDEALELFSSNTYDLIIADLSVRNSAGTSIPEHIDQNPQKFKNSLVLTCSESAAGSQTIGLLSENFAHIPKPIQIDQLLQFIVPVAQNQAAQRENEALQAQLGNTDELHSYMIEASPDIIYLLDSDGKFTYINERAEELLGYRKDEIIGKHYSELVREEDLDKAKYCFNEKRTGDRSTRNAGMWLKCKGLDASSRYFDTKNLAIELNAIGVYKSLENSDRKEFVGTYGVARDITDRRETEKMMHYQAYHDLLTGLPNRALFLDRLDTAISTARRKKLELAVMFLDLDRFKQVNDTLGHSVGDSLLQEASGRLKSCLRQSDTLARIGGDEFVILLPQVDSLESAKNVARKVVNEIKKPFTIEENDLYITVSIGISLFPLDGQSAEALMNNADIAMYHTKGKGKDGFQNFDDYMTIRPTLKTGMELDLRRAIKEEQFRVFFQPQVNSVSGKIIGVEALVRWQHPQKGLLSPASFMAVAEDSKLIINIGDWVVDAALKEIREWEKMGIDPVKISVNFSAAQLSQPDFVNKIIASLKKYSLSGNFLEVEITENVIMSNVDSILAKLKQLSDVGIRVAIDDFGTGYTSLGLLQKLPINSLKIDRIFIEDLVNTDSESSVVQAIVHMAQGLRLDMIAEGVETEDQVRRLQEIGCENVQGYLFSQGIPLQETRKLLLKNQSSAASDKKSEIEESLI